MKWINKMKRINVIGTSGSGKTTFSKKLARKLGLAYIELDELFWLDDWKESSNEIFFEKLKNKIDRVELQGYVIDGNYTRTQAIKWKNIDTVIWLDFPFYLNLIQSVKRTVIRLISQEKLWSNSDNKETLSNALSRDSIILWMIKTHAKNLKKYSVLINDPRYSHIRFIRLRSRKQTRKFLAEVNI